MTRDYSKHWDVGVTGAVVRDGKVLFVRRNYEPSKGTWTLPGGFAEHTETLDEAVKRELREETGIEVEVQGVVGVRTRYTEKHGAVLVIFRCELVAGEPHADEYEISAAEFFDADQIKALEPVFPLSREMMKSFSAHSAPLRCANSGRAVRQHHLVLAHAARLPGNQNDRANHGVVPVFG